MAAALYYHEELFLNAASTAGEIYGADRPLAEAREAMFELLGGALDGDRIVLTSGATEANCWALLRGARNPPSALVGATEHSSILAARNMLLADGGRACLVPVDDQGVVDLDALAQQLREETDLVSIQLANNETGVIQPLGEIARLVRRHAPNALIHSDATQAPGRIPIDLAGDLAELDLMSFSAHKFHGPKGIGGLFLREGTQISPLIPGEQERGLRGGTSNIPAAAGLAEAARKVRWALTLMESVAELRDWLEQELTGIHPDAYVHGQGADRLPNTSSIAFPGIRADDVVEQLALQGICVAAGSACTAGATAPSVSAVWKPLQHN